MKGEKVMKIPQTLVLVLLALSLGVSLADHGKPREGRNSFWVSLAGKLVQVGLLVWGGFFA